MSEIKKTLILKNSDTLHRSSRGKTKTKFRTRLLNQFRNCFRTLVCENKSNCLSCILLLKKSMYILHPFTVFCFMPAKRKFVRKFVNFFARIKQNFCGNY